MRFAFHATMCRTEHYLPQAQACEELGFHGFTFPDSICYPQVAETKYPYNEDGSRNFLEGTPFLEPFCAIPWLAAVTRRLRFTTSVVKLPIRNPVLVAKQTATVACITNNRFALGVGLSPWIEDFQSCGERWESRGPRMDEMIAIIRGLMTGEYYGHDTPNYQIPASKICPVPDQPVPILLGGHADVALKRAARIGDGWIHAGGTYETLKPLIEKLHAFRKEYGTDNKPFEFISVATDVFDLAGNQKLADNGVTEACVMPWFMYGGKFKSDIQFKIDCMKRFKEDVMDKMQ